jgi:predicted acylesterase/phospholipase RssA
MLWAGGWNPDLGKLYQISVQLAANAERGSLGGPRAGEDPLRFRAADGTYFVAEEELPRARARAARVEVIRVLDEREIPVRFVVQAPDAAVNDPPPRSAQRAVLARLLAEDRAHEGVCVRYLGRNRSVPDDGFVLDVTGGRRAYVWQIRDAAELEPGEPLAARFPALCRLFHDPGNKVVLALGSGGLKLFAHATVLRLLEAIGCADAVEEIWGSSGGAVVGLLYSQGLSPQAIEQTAYDLYAGRYQLELRPSKLQVLRHLLRDSLLSNPHHDATGFVDLPAGLGRMLDHYCASPHLRRPFYCTAFNLADCRPEVLTAEPVPEHLSDFVFQTEAREAALASSAVPLLFLPRRIERDGRQLPYVDGSTTEDVPLYSAARKWDLDREAGVERRERLVLLYVKLTGALDMYRTRTGRIGKIRLLQTIAAAGIETMHKRDVELLERRPDVTLLGLHLGEAIPDFFDTCHIPAYLRGARESFPAQLAQIEMQLQQG